MALSDCSPVERLIITALIKEMKAQIGTDATYKVYTGDGEPDFTGSIEDPAFLENICVSDETTIRFYTATGPSGFVWLIHGNGEDVISDCGGNKEGGYALINEVVDKVMTDYDDGLLTQESVENAKDFTRRVAQLSLPEDECPEGQDLDDYIANLDEERLFGEYHAFMEIIRAARAIVKREMGFGITIPRLYAWSDEEKRGDAKSVTLDVTDHSITIKLPGDLQGDILYERTVVLETDEAGNLRVLMYPLDAEEPITYALGPKGEIEEIL